VICGYRSCHIERDGRGCDNKGALELFGQPGQQLFGELACADQRNAREVLKMCRVRLP
jgi:hypothetical protein